MTATTTLIIAFCILAVTTAFQVGKPVTIHRNMELGIFGDALKGAFANDSSLGKPQNSGLTNVRVKRMVSSHTEIRLKSS
jgi:hypothetical protein